MEKLINWLKSGSYEPYFTEGVKENFTNNYNYIIIRIRKTDDIDFLFCQERYGGGAALKGGVTWDEPFEYAGIYCKKDGKVYDAMESLLRFIADSAPLASLTKEKLLSQMQEKVWGKVEMAVGNDRKNLSVSELSDNWLRSRLNLCAVIPLPLGMGI